MTEDIIKYDTAKKAKEKGFNSYQEIQYSKGVNTTTTYNYSEDQCRLFNDMYYAPPQSILQKWFRDTHGIFISIYNDVTNDWVYEIRSGYPESVYKGNCVMSKFTYTKYEMALEDALLYSLELLK
jgi:hypothetical protein